MDDSRSKPYKDARKQMELIDETNYAHNDDSIHKNGTMQDLRCYSVSHASSTHTTGEYYGQMDIIVADVGAGEQWKFKKGKSTSGASSKNWCFKDPELMRKKRVAGYKVYTVEGKVKGSIKNSFRWIKDRCNKMIHGHR